MHVFTTNDFTGHWPVGTAAVVVAESHDKAIELITIALKKNGLKWDGTLKQLPANECVVILNDGEY